jgi:hypothetical protein
MIRAAWLCESNNSIGATQAAINKYVGEGQDMQLRTLRESKDTPDSLHEANSSSDLSERSQQIDTTAKSQKTFTIDLPDFPETPCQQQASNAISVDDRFILDKIQNTIREYNYLLTS